MAYIGNTQQNQSYVAAVDYFSGNGSTVAFTLSKPVASVAQVQAVIANVPQNPSSAFTVSGNTITFTSAPPTGSNNIYVYYTSPNTQIVQPGQGTVGTNQLVDGSVTQSKIGSNIAGNGPAFSAYAAVATSMTNNTFTKIGFDTEQYDTNNNFASSRFTPTIAGYYQINAVVFTGGSTGVSGAGIYKNGTQFMYGGQSPNSSGGTTCLVGGLIYLNGSTDYVEIYAVQTTGGTISTQIGLSSWNVFNGTLVRAA